MSDNIQTNTTGRLMPCLQQKIDKTRCNRCDALMLFYFVNTMIYCAR